MALLGWRTLPRSWASVWSVLLDISNMADQEQRVSFKRNTGLQQVQLQHGRTGLGAQLQARWVPDTPTSDPAMLQLNHDCCAACLRAKA